MAQSCTLSGPFVFAEPSAKRSPLPDDSSTGCAAGLRRGRSMRTTRWGARTQYRRSRSGGDVRRSRDMASSPRRPKLVRTTRLDPASHLIMARAPCARFFLFPDYAAPRWLGIGVAPLKIRLPVGQPLSSPARRSSLSTDMPASIADRATMRVSPLTLKSRPLADENQQTDQPVRFRVSIARAAAAAR